MAKFAQVNIDTTANGGCDVAFGLLTALLAAGWTVQTSSDGTTYKSTPGSQITSPNSGANGWNNNNAWVRVQDPGGRREFVFKRNTSVSNWTIVYSALDKFVGGSPNATTAPTAADQQILISGSFWPTTAGTYRGHAIAESTPAGNVYGFWCFQSINGTGLTTGTTLICEPMDASSYPVEDEDPVVIIAGASNTLSVNNSGKNYWYKMNLTGEAWVTANPQAPTGNSVSSGAMAGGSYAGVNPYNGEDQHFVCGWGRSSDLAQPGWKGWSAYMKLKGVNRSFPDTTNLATDAYAFADSFLIPWPDGVTPLV